MKKVYLEEWENYPDLYERHFLSNRQVEVVIHKLTRHFKIRTVHHIYFTKKNGGQAGYTGMFIKVPKENASLGLVAHEVAHHLAFKKRCFNHARKFKTAMKRVVRYVRKKHFWNGNIKYSIHEGFRESTKFNRAWYDSHRQEKKKERCPARRGGVHQWYGQPDTLDDIQRKVQRFCCSFCHQIREEDWSNSTIDWDKLMQKFLDKHKEVPK